MKIIAMANGGFAIPTLRELKNSRHEIVAVIAMPVRTTKKGDKSGIPPIRTAAVDFLADIPFYDPENVNSPEGVELIRNLDADLIFICDYGKILSRDILASTRLGGVNLHGSLLPKYRGAAPINRAVQAGERELGVSVIFLAPQVDAGPIVALDSYEPSIEDTAVEIEARLAEMGAPLVLDAIDKIEKGTCVPIEQKPEDATSAPKLHKEEGRIDWSANSSAIVNRYRAFQPWPRVYSDWLKKEDDLSSAVRLILGPFKANDDPTENMVLDERQLAMEPGQIVEVSKSAFWVRTGDGALRVLYVQPSGKKNQPTEAFLRGYPLKIGDRLC